MEVKLRTLGMKVLYQQALHKVSMVFIMTMIAAVCTSYRDHMK